MPLSPGDRAPDFDLPTDNGRVALKDLEGKVVVLYFYPKDDTSGCTAEARGFTDAAGDFGKSGAVVVGVSKDSAASHDKFRAKYGLNMLLGSAKDDDVVERYGAWVEKKNYGRTHFGIQRSTFVIDADGDVAKILRRVNPRTHADAVLKALPG